MDDKWWMVFALAGAMALLAGIFLFLWLKSRSSLNMLMYKLVEAEGFEKASITYETLHKQASEQLAEAKQEVASLGGELRRAREKSVALETEQSATEERMAEQQQNLAAMEKKFQDQFENLANKIFDEKNKSFNELSQKGLQDILGPFKERFGDFQKTVSESFGEQAKEQFALKNEIQRIVKVSESMTLQTESLTKALKGDVKAQGNWGEVMLEKILEDSGLRKDEDYTLQGSGMELKSAEGKHQKPDVIVNLPENKHIIIDAKVSLTRYERFCAEEDEQPRREHLQQFVDSIRAHIIGLEKRDYQHNSKLGTPDLVLLFLPIEGAFSLAMQADPEIQSFAWNKKIAVVCPSTLFATLRTIESVWRLERQHKNAEKIAQKGGALYDKIAGFIKDMEAMGNQLGTVQKSYDGAMNKLSSGKGNILGRTAELEKLGAKTSKKLPAGLLNTDEEGEDNEELVELELVEKQ